MLPYVCMTPLVLTLPSKVRFGVDSVFIDGVNVVLRRLQGSQLGAQVTVLAAIGTSGAWETEKQWMFKKVALENRKTLT